jgi:hypothetical protein
MVSPTIDIIPVLRMSTFSVCLDLNCKGLLQAGTVAFQISRALQQKEIIYFKTYF